MGKRGRKPGVYKDPSPKFVMCYGDYCGLFMGKGVEVLFDTSDLEAVLLWHWSISNNRYAFGYRHGRRISMHRLLLNPGKRLTVDHKDGNGFDNRRQNLRIATHQENSRNKRSLIKKGYKGVFARKDHPSFKAYICVGGKYVNLGNFKTAEDAAIAYNQAAIEQFGEFAYLNKLAGVG